MKFKTLLASLVAVASLTACEDVFEDGSLQPDGSKPYLVIRNPTQNQALSKSDGLRVKLTATDKDKLKELRVSVRDNGTGVDYINFSAFPEKKILEIDTVLNVSELKQGDYTLKINAIDFRTNEASTEILFSVKEQGKK
ncbi:hypothetical protein [uncultured Pontibacter sp.]|uniref:hypothetical protein n=1 Tax=uncultured Pontibacter sp. TaxID=453356 RepID=UPI002638C3F9|nr:hypothetical protein [uncultured Pontibacter sp.]